MDLALDVKMITPMFIYGADPRGFPELRAAPFRGALRFWLRALLGARYGDDLNGLAQAESLVFGSTGSGSPVVVAVQPAPQAVHRDMRELLPHTHSYPTPAFTEGSRFRLNLRPRRGLTDLPAGLLESLAALSLLGGVGRRSRRGFGSVRLAAPAGAAAQSLPGEFLEALGAPQDGNALASKVQNALTWALGSVAAAGYATLRAAPRYPMFAPGHALVLVCQDGFQSYEEAMRAFWIQVLRNATYRHPRAYGYAEGDARRASPLILHIAESEDHGQVRYHLVLTAFRSDPAPAGAPGWRLVSAALDQCATLWTGNFVYGGRGAW